MRVLPAVAACALASSATTARAHDVAAYSFSRDDAVRPERGAGRPAIDHRERSGYPAPYAIGDDTASPVCER